MKRRIEAHHLRQFRIAPTEQLDQLNFRRQVFGIVRFEASQFGQQRRSHSLWLTVLAATVDHAMPDAAHSSKTNLLLDPINHKRAGREMVGRVNRSLFAFLSRNVRFKSGIGQSNAFQFA